MNTTDAAHPSDWQVFWSKHLEPSRDANIEAVRSQNRAEFRAMAERFRLRERHKRKLPPEAFRPSDAELDRLLSRPDLLGPHVYEDIWRQRYIREKLRSSTREDRIARIWATVFVTLLVGGLMISFGGLVAGLVAIATGAIR